MWFVISPVFANYAIVDFSKPSTERRFIIYNDSGKEIYRTWVAHGVGSGEGVYAVRFSNEVGSLASSLGLYRIGNKYYGKYGMSFKLHGLSKTNSNAYKRNVVLHPAPYIGNGRIENSWGCLAIAEQDWKIIIKLLHPGNSITAIR